MKLLLLLLPIVAFGQCAVVVTSATTTTCVPLSQLVPPPYSTISVSGTTTTITGNLVVTGTVQTGAANAPSVWNIVRSDGVACTVKFSPTNPASNTTSMVITCP